MVMPTAYSVVLATVVGLAMVSLAAGDAGTATFYTPPYTRTVHFVTITCLRYYYLSVTNIHQL
jgi:hypothetical protein